LKFTKLRKPIYLFTSHIDHSESALDFPVVGFLTD
jgi:hypothetical protein